MNRRILLIGRSGCGKSSLIMRLQGKAPQERKTQAAEYYSDFIDVPGEYLEVRSFYRALIVLTGEACAVALAQAADDGESLYPSGLARAFSKPVVGVITKTDLTPADPARAEAILRQAGAGIVFLTSSVMETGIDGLHHYLDEIRNREGGCGG